MLREITFVSISCVAGFILAASFTKFEILHKLGNGIKLFWLGLVGRIDRLLTGNDGNYSHTRFLNVLWGIGSFVLVAIAILRGIKIPDSLLVLMGASMGISMTGTVLNKIQEIKDKVNGQ